MFEVPETRYAKSGDVNIAYQVVGNGPFDLIHVPPFVSNIELQWEDPWWPCSSSWAGFSTTAVSVVLDVSRARSSQSA